MTLEQALSECPYCLCPLLNHRLLGSNPPLQTPQIPHPHCQASFSRSNFRTSTRVLFLTGLEIVGAALWVHQGGQAWQEPSQHHMINIVMRYEIQSSAVLGSRERARSKRDFLWTFVFSYMLIPLQEKPSLPLHGEFLSVLQNPTEIPPLL